MLAHHADAPVSTHKDLAESLVEMSPDLYSRALRLSRSPMTAEDLVQDTVERAIRFRSNFQSGTNLRAWLYQILFSVFVTRCRRARRERVALDVLSTDPCAWTLPTSHDEIRSTKLSPSLARVMDTLPKMFRETVILVDLEEMAYKDAARKLGVPVGTVMSRLHRGRRMLAEAMREAGIEGSEIEGGSESGAGAMGDAITAEAA